ncbi:sugar ABC transporter substrate-binding protein [Cytobacillus oceanisediminis]
MKKTALIGLAAGAALALTACSGTGGADAPDAKDLDLKYAVVTHAPPGDAFWDRVKVGAEKAGEDYGVDISYAGDPDPAEQSKLIDSAVADGADGIVVSMANPDGVKDSVTKAVSAGVPVVTINAGQEQSREFGAITHVGQSETLAGEAVGERMKEDGFTNVICVIQAAGAVNLEQRCAAAADGLDATMENVQVDGTDDNQVISTLTSKLQSDGDIDGILTLGGQQAIDAVEAVEQSGSDARIATFDLSEDVLNAIKAGTVEFAVDQQPFVQGFEGVSVLYLKSINGNDLGGGQPIFSGPAFVDKSNADPILEFAKNGTR